MNLVDKDALVAEIEKLKKSHDNWSFMGKCCHQEYEHFLSFINTLEVKEADSLTPEEIKKICIIYDNLNRERKCATILYNSDETFFNHVLMEYKVIAQKGE